MTESAELLKLIETVDSSDDEKMTEIDARVWCFIHQLPLDGIRDWRYSTRVKYNRSRDALKAIRPQNKRVRGIDDIGRDWRCIYGVPGTNVVFIAHAATEELAELHAIIQAIEHDRLNVRQPERAAD